MAEPNGGAGGGAPTFTQEQRDELSNIIGGQVSNMIGARFKTFLNKDLKEAIGPILGESLKSALPDLIKQHVPAPPDPEDPKGKGKGKDATAFEESVAYRTMKAQLDEMNQQLAETRRREEEQRAENVRQKVRSKTLEAIAQQLGVTDSERAAIIADHLIEAKRLVRHDEDLNKAVFDDGENAVALDQGLRQWAKTSAAKLLLPPAGGGQGGAGSRPGNGAGGGSHGGGVSKDQAIGNAFGALDRIL